MKERDKYRDDQSRRRFPSANRFSRDDYDRNRQFRADAGPPDYFQDQDQESFDPRDSAYGTGANRPEDFDADQDNGDYFAQRARETPWDEGPDYVERSRRRLSIGSERPYGSQAPHPYPSAYGPGSYYGQPRGIADPSHREGPFERSTQGSFYDRPRDERSYTTRLERHQSYAFGRSHEHQPDRGFAGRGPKGYQRSDERIRDDVCDRLTEHPGIDASEIEVKVEKSHIYLSGTVHDRHAKRLAEDIVEQVRGVTDVINQIRIASSSDKSEAATQSSSTKPSPEKPKGDVLHS